MADPSTAYILGGRNIATALARMHEVRAGRMRVPRATPMPRRPMKRIKRGRMGASVLGG